VRYAYFYFMKDEPERVREAAPRHAAYWRGLALPGYLGGPFADQSGGMITFEATSEDEVHRIAARDPFRQEGLMESHWLKEWQVL
jgi:uncharacterized protein YciI